MEIRKNSDGNEFVLIDNKWRPFKDGNAYDKNSGSWSPIGDPRNELVEQSKGGYVSQMVGNIPRSASNLATDMVQPFTHPAETIEGITNLARGGYSKLINAGMPEEQAFDAAVNYYGERYGGVDEIAYSLREDPVGVLSDASMLAGVGLGKLPGKAGQIGKIAGSVDPSLLISNAAIKGSSVAAKFINNKMMLGMEPSELLKGAMKFSTTMKESERAGLIKTMLDEQIMPNHKGNQKVSGILQEGNIKTEALLDAVPETKLTSRDKLSDGLPDIIGQYATNSLDDLGNKAAVDKVGRKFNTTTNMIDEAGKLIPDELPPMMTPKDVQAFKKKAYNSIDFDAKRKTDALEAEIAAQKDIARQARLRIEEFTPEIKGVNQRMGKLYDLQEPLQRSSNRISNRDVSGLGMAMKIVAGAQIGDIPGAMAGLAMGLLDNPKLKAAAALKGHQLTGRNITQQLMDANSAKGHMGREVMNLLQDQRSQGLLGEEEKL